MFYLVRVVKICRVFVLYLTGAVNICRVSFAGYGKNLPFLGFLFDMTLCAKDLPCMR